MSRYRRYLLTAPWWQHSAIFAVTIGTVCALFIRLEPPPIVSWSDAALYGAVVGLVTGAFLGPLTAWSTRRARKATGDLPTEQFVSSSEAVRRGSVPTDPTIRRGAYQLAVHQLDMQRRWRMVLVGSSAVVIAADSYLAIKQSPWYWLGAAFFAAMMIGFFRQRARLRQRVELLRPDRVEL